MENWRACKKPFELYLVSRDGIVRRGDTGRLCKASIDGRGYQNYWLQSNDGQYTSAKTHVLVAEAWLGLRPDEAQVHHKDGNQLNNHVDNLEYLTRSEHRQEHAADQQGEAGANAVLTQLQVLTIRLLVEHGAIQVMVAQLFGVSKQNIGDIVKRRSWTHI